MGSRNKQRPTFEKRQREIARQERQAEKRARKRARADGTYVEPVDEVDPEESSLPPGIGEYPEELNARVSGQAPTSEGA